MVGIGGEGPGGDEMLQGTFGTDTASMNCPDVSSEVCSFLKALHYQYRTSQVPQYGI